MSNPKQRKQKQNYKVVDDEEVEDRRSRRDTDHSWPNLPPQLIKLIQRNAAALCNSITFRGISKSWISKLSHCNNSVVDCSAVTSSWPLQISHHSSSHTLIDSFNITYPNTWIYKKLRIPPNSSQYIIVGYSQEVVITRDRYHLSELLHLWDPVEYGYCHLPPWDSNLPFKLVVLSSSPFRSRSPDNNMIYPRTVVMVLTGETHPAFVFYLLSSGMNTWEKQDFAVLDPNSRYPTSNSNPKKKNLMYFTNAIGMNGKFYALSMQGTLAVIEYVDSTLKVTAICEQRAVPSIHTPWSHFKEYLVEFDESVLVVFVNYGKLGGEWSVTSVEVMRLNQEEDKLSWVKMKSLGEMSVFIGENCCVCGLASDLNCRSNFVYFTQRNNGHQWWMYDVESGRIFPYVISS